MPDAVLGVLSCTIVLEHGEDSGIWGTSDSRPIPNFIDHDAQSGGNTIN